MQIRYYFTKIDQNFLCLVCVHLLFFKCHPSIRVFCSKIQRIASYYALDNSKSINVLKIAKSASNCYHISHASPQNPGYISSKATRLDESPTQSQSCRNEKPIKKGKQRPVPQPSDAVFPSIITSATYIHLLVLSSVQNPWNNMRSPQPQTLPPPGEISPVFFALIIGTLVLV